jgi:K+-sensing histidine kinase KdpD
MSLIDLYAAETKFEQKKKEYISLMNSIKFSCLGKKKTSETCIKAAKINAEMQTALMKMSSISKKYPTSNVSMTTQQTQMLKISDQLDAEMKQLLTNDKLQEDTTLLSEMNKEHIIVWGFAFLCILSMVVYQYKKI